MRMTNDNLFLRSDLNWVHKLEGSAKLDLKIGGVIGKLANTTYRDTSGNPAVPAMFRQIDSAGTDRGLTSTGKYTNPLWEGHALAIGWDGGYSNRTDSRRETNYQMPQVVVPNGDENYKGHVTRLALYAQDEWNVTPRWSVYLGRHPDPGRREHLRRHAFQLERVEPDRADAVQAAGHQERPGPPGRHPHLQGAQHPVAAAASLHHGEQQPGRARFRG
jgi:hypothetical protein